ncbi:nitrite reductase small subunit NirD [Paenibacillus mucilaginosus]|uniref:Nitrite reductase, small subunit n=3 Tax=Paenibacillus mucilaginosus TaxID=61624 RepID=H6NT04_9BACL|nr:nitrite reductase small subunit NirD [Paenibacillus mucilaginosus]AEI39261.1 nitrite reductase (NAD(P)H), small subunit [Paenibacillus mucilaginosus KNP414]AFC27545.1 nitrite reductase, small subunit [Paenibacillus mucilaginosus 3016]AFH59699.1 nitrite reductase [Paenibacillus mucilaginosus K02]MCG7217099.1 nitrite reductase small subunit NirD [Paenibacillus mucilaginosus]WDM28266.1 nitrite reductase small subunit NirD [Paenibacillus mucilaginosus]
MKRILVGKVSDIPTLRSRTVRVGGTEVAVFKLSSGALYAVENSCPHKNGKLSEGIVCDHHVFCPLHDWKINVKDGLVQAPDEGCVKTFQVETDETDSIYLLVEETGGLTA